MKKIVLTGGPCAGKSTALKFVKDHLEQNGYKVYIIYETATELIKSGADNKTNQRIFQPNQIILQTVKEDVIESIARKENPSTESVIIVCDRATIDVHAFCTEDEFEYVLGVTGYTERQESMNQAYDAFNDLALALGIEPKSISLGDAKLIIAFGSRGKGTAMAHYEVDTNVINLTKMKGAGCVSHEWFHAIDYNIGQKAGCPISFTRTYEDNPHLLPAPVREAIDALIYKPNYVNTKFYKDAKKIDEMHSKRDSYGYWASTVELFARAGDSFVKDELKAMGARNDYLCGKSQYTIDAEGTAINPTGEDAKRINDAFRKMIEYFKQRGWL